jgi:hypothetical protein
VLKEKMKALATKNKRRENAWNWTCFKAKEYDQ